MHGATPSDEVVVVLEGCVGTAVIAVEVPTLDEIAVLPAEPVGDSQTRVRWEPAAQADEVWLNVVYGDGMVCRVADTGDYVVDVGFQWVTGVVLEARHRTQEIEEENAVIDVFRADPDVWSR